MKDIFGYIIMKPFNIYYKNKTHKNKNKKYNKTVNGGIFSKVLKKKNYQNYLKKLPNLLLL